LGEFVTPTEGLPTRVEGIVPEPIDWPATPRYLLLGENHVTADWTVRTGGEVSLLLTERFTLDPNDRAAESDFNESRDHFVNLWTANAFADVTIPAEWIDQQFIACNSRSTSEVCGDWVFLARSGRLTIVVMLSTRSAVAVDTFLAILDPIVADLSERDLSI
jgi:hypothetical protein